MGSTTDKIKGMTNEMVGSAKEGIGKTFDKPDLVAKGMAQEAEGKAQRAMGDVKDAVKKAKD